MKRLSELIGIVNVVYFSPDEMRFVKAGPDERRRFLDISLSQQSKTYFKSLAKYNKILQQRNTLLKNENRNENLKTLLSIWDEGMAEVGANLILARKNYVKKLSTLAKDSHFELSDGKETLSLQYECAIKATLTTKFTIIYFPHFRRRWSATAPLCIHRKVRTATILK